MCENCIFFCPAGFPDDTGSLRLSCQPRPLRRFSWISPPSPCSFSPSPPYCQSTHPYPISILSPSAALFSSRILSFLARLISAVHFFFCCGPCCRAVEEEAVDGAMLTDVFCSLVPRLCLACCLRASIRCKFWRVRLPTSIRVAGDKGEVARWDRFIVFGRIIRTHLLACWRRVDLHDQVLIYLFHGFYTATSVGLQVCSSHRPECTSSLKSNSDAMCELIITQRTSIDWCVCLGG